MVKTTSVHAFSREDAEFGMSQFVLRSDLLNPSNKFLTVEGKAQIEVRLTFVDDVTESDAATAPQETRTEAENQQAETTLETTQHLLSYDSARRPAWSGSRTRGPRAT